MDKIKELFDAIARTLATVKVDNSDGAWNKLLGCINACTKGVQICEELEKEGDPDA